MTINITGPVRQPDGSLFINSIITIQRMGGVVSQSSSVLLPDEFTVMTDGIGEVDFEIEAGQYQAYTDGQRERRIRWDFNVPETPASRTFESCVEAATPTITPDLVLQAEAAADRAEAAAVSINTLAVDNTAALKALDTVQWDAALIESGANVGTYVWTAGDFTLQHTEEAGADFFYIKANTVAINAGAWVRQVVKADPAAFHEFKAPDGTVNARVEALETASSFVGLMGGVTPFGPTIYATGSPEDVDLQIAMKGEGRLTIGNAQGRLMEVIEGPASYVPDRIPQVAPGASLAGVLAKIGAVGGLDIGDTTGAVIRVVGGGGAGVSPLVVSAPDANYALVSTLSGKSMVVFADGGLQLQRVSNMTLTDQEFVVAAGGTVNLTTFSMINMINPTAPPLASLTINFPAAPANGSRIQVVTRGTINGITWASLGGHFILGQPTSLTTTAPATFWFKGAAYGWQKVAS